jgi:hypothetical protein
MLNISKTIYMGWDTTKPALYKLPEAEVAPYGESIREQKKLTDITAKYTILKEFDNIPLPGFTLYGIDDRKYTSSKLSWLVIDPRGVLVNISSKNLQNILEVTGITEGLIQQKCIWARNDSDTTMSLIPMSSETYSKAVENTVLIENKVDIKDVDIGDTVLLQNGLQGVYLGVASLYGSLNNYRIRNKYKVMPVLRRQILEKEPGRYFYDKDIGILKIIEKSKTPMSSKDAIDRMNAAIDADNGYFSNSPRINTTYSHYYYSMGGFISLVSSSSVQRVSMTYEEITLNEATTLFLQAEVVKDVGMLMVEDDNQKKYIVDFPYLLVANKPAQLPTMPYKFHVCEIDTSDDKHITLTSGRRHIWGGTTNTLPGYSLKDFKKFYKIVKHVKKETYI